MLLAAGPGRGPRVWVARLRVVGALAVVAGVCAAVWVPAGSPGDGVKGDVPLPLAPAIRSAFFGP